MTLEIQTPSEKVLDPLRTFQSTFSEGVCMPITKVEALCRGFRADLYVAFLGVSLRICTKHKSNEQSFQVDEKRFDC